MGSVCFALQTKPVVIDDETSLSLPSKVAFAIQKLLEHDSGSVFNWKSR